MSRRLLIVESPNKIKTIKELLKNTPYSDIIIKASVGHITAIADDRNSYFNSGIYPDKNFKINYKVADDKKQIVDDLKQQVQLAEIVYLGTDPDREGEVISYQLKKFLNIPDSKYRRVTYHEITQKAIVKALDDASTIDMNMADAGMTRAALDKLIGYRLSPIARSEINAKSVGRCQSAGLKIVVDREKEIQNFKPEKYFELYLNFEKNKTQFKAKYVGTATKQVSKFDKKEDCDKVAFECKGKDYIISNIEVKELNQNPPVPFITSTLQQEVSSKLSISVKDTMNCAQKLFEGLDINGKHIALVTYIRSDDPNISPEFIPQIKDYIFDNFGKKYYRGIKEIKTSENAQAGHECIRPVNLDITPEYLKKYITDEKLLRVYDIIYRRTIAALMQPRKISDTQYTISNNKHNFLLSSKEQLFDGWKAIYNFVDKEKEEVVKETFDTGEKILKPQLECLEKLTTPPKRFDESSLVKTLDKLGIGRPSTYATILATLLDPKRNYCIIDNKKIVPTELAIKLIDFMDKNFTDLVDSSYTAELEKSLDKIAEGKLKNTKFLESFFKQLEEDVSKIPSQAKSDKKCPQCGKPLVVRKGRYSLFLGCSGYPNCTYLENIKK